MSAGLFQSRINTRECAMNKVIAGFLLSSALMVPAAFASARSDCLAAVKTQFKTDFMACKDLQGKDKKNCQKDAVKKVKIARKACPAKTN